MPAKSRRKKKFSPQRKPQPAQAPARSATDQTASPDAAPVETTTAASVQRTTTPAARRPVVRTRGGGAGPSAPATMPVPYSRVGSELKMIGIIAGALLVVLIIVFLIIH